jgi:small GTP-binding protein
LHENAESLVSSFSIALPNHQRNAVSLLELQPQVFATAMSSEEPDIILSAPRGRARSGALHGDVDDELNTDLDVLNAAIEGKEPPARRSSSSDSSRNSKPTLSKKTIATLTKLEVATATPAELLGEGGEPKKGETEEEAAERELEAAEKKKRGAEAAAVSAGAGTSAVAGVRTLKGGTDKDYDIMIKLLLLGDGGVGKTSLMLRYSDDKFSTSLLATAGVDYKTQLLEIEGKRVKCQIWDTAGQQKFHTITQAYYKAAQGIVLVYDISDPTESSFNNVRYWMENITKHANLDTPKILIGNKADMKGKKVRRPTIVFSLCVQLMFILLFSNADGACQGQGIGRRVWNEIF